MATKWPKIAVIPDTQCKPDVPLDHLTAAGNYIAEKRPDYIIHLGDHWDFPSLSSYDYDKPLKMEGRRVKDDINAGNRGMRLLNKALGKCKAKRILLRGNHEDRLTRAIEKCPSQLEGLLDWSLLDTGLWQVVPFLKPVRVQGTLFCHYFYNPRSGRPYTGTAHSLLRQVGSSYVQGHRQGLDVGSQDLPMGGRRRGIIAGSFYQHDEDYLGPQGDHWRGILMLHEAREGNFDLMEVSMDFLMRRYA
jgi:hypothetical protein